MGRIGHSDRGRRWRLAATAIPLAVADPWEIVIIGLANFAVLLLKRICKEQIREFEMPCNRPSRLWRFNASIPLLCALLSFGNFALAQSRLTANPPVVEQIDSTERISGNAATGLVLHDGDLLFGRSNLWAFLSGELPPQLTLTISSIDGRYYGEVEYPVPDGLSGWVSVDLDEFSDFEFLNRYMEPLNEVATLLVDRETQTYFPLRWGPDFEEDPQAGPPEPQDSTVLRVFVNTERADAFVVDELERRPIYCTNASTLSSFKFNAICEINLGAIRPEEAVNGTYQLEYLDIHRRSGARTLEPIGVDVQVLYRQSAE